MLLKAACLALGLGAVTGFGAYAAPAAQTIRLEPVQSQAETVQYHRYRYRSWRRYPSAYWTRDFWGRLRYIGPNSNRTNTHQY
jgi:hypothetical protein